MAELADQGGEAAGNTGEGDTEKSLFGNWVPSGKPAEDVHALVALSKKERKEIWNLNKVDKEKQTQRDIWTRMVKIAKAFNPKAPEDTEQETAYGAFSNTERGGRMLGLKAVTLAVFEYQLMSSMDRAKFSKLYNTLKDHLRTFYRPVYNEFSKIIWMTSNSIISGLFNSKYYRGLGEIQDLLVNNITLVPATLSQVLVDTFRGKVLKNLPEAESSNQMVVSMVVVVGTLAAVAEVMIVSRKFKTYRNVLAYLVEQLNSMVIKSSYRYKNVLRFFVRILRGLGPTRSGYLLEAMGVLQNPTESLAAFAGLPTFKRVDTELKKSSVSAKKLKKAADKMLDELDASRDKQRANTQWSVLNVIGKRKLSSMIPRRLMPGSVS
eukprot:2721535-Rhodomonas_salina.2